MRGVALRPAGPDARAGRQDVAHPGREVFPPAPFGRGRGHAVRRHPMGGGAALGFGASRCTASAMAVFRPRGVVEFLMLDREFPRAIQFCLTAARDSLHAISGTPLGTFRHPPEKLLGQLCSDLSFTGGGRGDAIRSARVPGRIADQAEPGRPGHRRDVLRGQDSAAGARKPILVAVQ